MSRAALVSGMNLLFASEDCTDAKWSKNTGIVATANTPDVTDPVTGLNTASKLVYDGSGVATAFRLAQNITSAGGGSGTQGRVYTAACYLRLASGSRRMGIGNNAVSPVYQTITTSWQKVIVSGVNPSQALQFVLFIYDDDGGTNSAFTFYLARGQYVLGAIPGEYRGTTSAQVNASAALRRSAIV